MRIREFLQLPKRSLRVARRAAFASLALAASSQVGWAQTWNASGPGGSWGVASNWNPAVVPNSAAANATFANIGIGTVTLDANRQVGSLLFSNTTGSYVLDSTAQNLTISNGSTGTLNQSGAGANTINARIVSPNLSGTISAGSLSLRNLNNSISAGTLSVTGGANLTLTASGTQNSAGSAAISLNGSTLTWDSASGTNPGLLGQYYSRTPQNNNGNNGWSSFNTLQALTNELTGVTPNVTQQLTGPIDFPASGGNFYASTDGNPFDSIGVNIGNDNLVARWSGKIDAGAGGTFDFASYSDDGTILFIDGVKIVDNNFFQGVTKRGGAATLTAGLHDVTAAFYEGGGGAGAHFTWDKHDGNGEVLIPGSAFQSVATSQFTATTVVNVAGNSTINSVLTDGASGFATANLAAGSTLNVVGSIKADHVNVSTAGTVTLAPANGTQFTVGQFSDNGHVANVVVNGAGGTVSLNQSVGASSITAGTTFTVTQGTLSANGLASATSLGVAPVTLNGGTLQLAGAIDYTSPAAGLFEGKLNGSFNETEANPNSAVTLLPRLAETNSIPPWGDDQTWVYTGQILVTASGHLSFAENIDDNALVKIDGQQVLRDTGWNNVGTSGDLLLTPGWHGFELRVGNGGGGAGAVAQNGFADDYGFGINNAGTTSNNGADYFKPIDDGTMNQFRHGTETFYNNVVTGAAGVSSTINVAGSAGARVAAYSPLAGSTLVTTGNNLTFTATNLGVGNATISPVVNNTNFLGTISDGANTGVTLTKAGLGTTVINQAVNDLNGTSVQINAGKLSLQAAGGLDSAVGTSINAGGTLELRVTDPTSPVSLQALGRLLVAPSSGSNIFLDQNYAIPTNGILEIDSRNDGGGAAGLTGTGAITLAQGAIVRADNTEALTGAQLLAANIGSGKQIELNGGAYTLTNLSQVGPGTIVLMGGNHQLTNAGDFNLANRTLAAESNAGNRQLDNGGGVLLTTSTTKISAGENMTLFLADEINPQGQTLHFGAPNLADFNQGGNIVLNNSFTLAGIEIDRGSLESNNSGSATQVLSSSGPINVHEGANFRVNANATAMHDKVVAAGGIGAPINVDKGATLDFRLTTTGGTTLADGANTTNVRQDIHFTGAGTGVSRLIMDEDGDNTGGNPNQGFYLSNVTFDNGAVVATGRYDLNPDEARLAVKLGGDASVVPGNFGNGQDVTFQSLSGLGTGHHTLTQTTSALNTNPIGYEFRGTIGDHVRVEQEHGYGRFYNGVTLAATAEVRNLGNVLGPGDDGYIEIFGGDDGTLANRVSGGTFVLGANQDIRLYAIGGQTNVLNSTVRVVNDGDNNNDDGYLGGSRDGNLNGRVSTVYGNVVVADNAHAHTEDVFFADLDVNNLTLEGSGSIMRSNGVTYHLSSFQGLGTFQNGTAEIVSGGVLTPGFGVGSVGNLTAANLQTDSGSSLSFELAAPGTNDHVQVNGTLNLSGSTTLNLTNASGMDAGTYTLFNYGSLPSGVSNLTVGAAPGGFSYAINDTGSSIDLVVTSLTGTNQWTGTSGSWNSAAKWTGGIVPNAPDAVARLWGNNTGPTTVTLSAPVSVDTLSFNSGNPYTVAGGSTLTLSGATRAQVDVVSGSHSITAPIVAATNARIVGAGSLTTGAVTTNGTLSVASTVTSTAVSGTGSVTVEPGHAMHAQSYNLTTGTLTVQGTATNNTSVLGMTASNPYPAGDSSKVSVAQSVSIANDGAVVPAQDNAGPGYIDLTTGNTTAARSYYGTLDLGNNDLIIVNGGGSMLNDITDAIRSGYNSFATWDGKGLTSSAAADTNNATYGYLGVGIVYNDDDLTPGIAPDTTGGPFLTEFDGKTLTGGELLIKTTYYGDANLDGVVDFIDYGFIDAGIAGAGTGWAYGDFNYDGHVDFIDYGFIDAGVAGTGIGGQVPEPGSLTLLALGSIGLLAHAARRRRIGKVVKA